MKIGFLGFGEAAFNIALGLGQSGITEMYAYDAMENHEEFGKLVKKRAWESKVILQNCPEDVVREAELLFAAVPSSNTVELCESICGDLRPGQLYVDVSASTPASKKRIDKILDKTGALFTDAAMLGSLPQDKHRVPIFASGKGAKTFRELMSPYGMRITCVDGGAGAASAIKLIRSIYMKGIAALMIEMLQAADAYQVADEVIQSIGKSMDGIAFEEHLNRLVIGTAIHAKRRGKELEGSKQMLEECGVDDSMTCASKKKHELLAQMDFPSKYLLKSPQGWQEILSDMRR